MIENIQAKFQADVCGITAITAAMLLLYNVAATAANAAATYCYLQSQPETLKYPG